MLYYKFTRDYWDTERGTYYAEGKTMKEILLNIVSQILEINSEDVKIKYMMDFKSDRCYIDVYYFKKETIFINGRLTKISGGTYIEHKLL